MALPWFRVDTNWHHNDKMLELADAGQFRAMVVYVASIGYAVEHETDGLIPKRALPLLHARTKEAEQLVDAGLWHKREEGWDIHNFLRYQKSRDYFEVTRNSSTKANCSRWQIRNGKECICGQH